MHDRTENGGLRKRPFHLLTFRVQYLGIWRDASLDQYNLSLENMFVVHGFHVTSAPVLMNLLIIGHGSPRKNCRSVENC